MISQDLLYKSNEGSTGANYARDHHVENIFVSADKMQNHKQAHENIIVSYYVLQFLASYFENWSVKAP